MSEKWCCEVAACLLKGGADSTTRNAAGLKASDIAEQRGMLRFSQMVHHWSDMQVCKMLRATMSRRRSAPLSDAATRFMNLTDDVCELIYAGLAPRVTRANNAAEGGVKLYVYVYVYVICLCDMFM